MVNKYLIQYLTNSVVAVSEDIRNRLVKFEGISLDRINVVYNGLEIHDKISEKDRNNLRLKFGFHKSDFVVGTIGRFDPIKNLELLINSIEMSHKENVNIKGLLVGDGVEYDRLKNLINKKKLSSVISLPGFRTDTNELVQCMDLFVLSSFSEGISLSLLEALSQGIPVAVSNVGGNVEIVSDKKNGWIFHTDSSKGLINIIKYAYSNPGKSRQMGTAGKQKFKKQFTFFGMLSQYRKIYNNLLEVR